MKARVRFTNILIMLVLFSAFLNACGGAGDTPNISLGGEGGDGFETETLETNVTVLSNIGNNDPIMGALACAYEDDTCQDIVIACCSFLTDSNGECYIRKTYILGLRRLNTYLSVSADGYQNECQASKMNKKGYDHTVYLNPPS